jgi:hypothetical protein
MKKIITLSLTKSLHERIACLCGGDIATLTDFARMQEIDQHSA